jgi:hypothetical protein
MLWLLAGDGWCHPVPTLVSWRCVRCRERMYRSERRNRAAGGERPDSRLRGSGVAVNLRATCSGQRDERDADRRLPNTRTGRGRGFQFRPVLWAWPSDELKPALLEPPALGKLRLSHVRSDSAPAGSGTKLTGSILVG